MFQHYYAVSHKAASELTLRAGVRHMLVSYAFYKNGLPENLIKRVKAGTLTLMADSGAFTNAHSGEKHTNLKGYCEWLASEKKYLDSYVVLDDLMNRQTTLRNFYAMKEAGLSPMFVDHLWFKGINPVLEVCKTGEKVCWGGLVHLKDPSSETGIGQRARGIHPDIAKRVDMRKGYVKEKPRTKIHLLGTGLKIPWYAKWFDLVDTIDSTAYLAPGKFGGIYHIKFNEGGWPNIVKAKPGSDVFRDLSHKLRSMKLDPDNWIDRCYHGVKVMERYFKLLWNRWVQEKKSGNEIGIGVHKMEEMDDDDPALYIVKTDVLNAKRFYIRNLDDEETEKAEWSRAFINDLPDSAFLYIEPGGEKDEEGKTVPRSLRRFPIRDEGGSVDLPHLRNAIARIPQAKIPDLSESDLRALQDRARQILAQETKGAEMKKQQALVQVFTVGNAVKVSISADDLSFVVDADKGAIGKSTTMCPEAVEIYRHFDRAIGNRYLKPLLEPNELAIEGNTSIDKSAAATVARPWIERGLSRDTCYEYFLTGDRRWCGVLELRQNSGDGQSDTGKKTWVASISKSALPSVLRSDVVPPLGESAMPETLMAVTPEKHRFWLADDAQRAREQKDALVKSRFFTEDNVWIVEGKFRRVEIKRYLYQPEYAERNDEPKSDVPSDVRKVLSSEGVSRIALIKTDEERYVLGIVLEPNDGKDGAPLDPDSQGDIYSKKAVREAAHRFMEEFRNVGLMHKVLVNGRVKILESFVVPDGTGGFVIKDPKGREQKIREGAWLMGFRIQDDELWEQVKSDQLRGLSIGGSARRIAAKP